VAIVKRIVRRLAKKDQGSCVTKSFMKGSINVSGDTCDMDSSDAKVYARVLQIPQ
jgi:hypothetical protein